MATSTHTLLEQLVKIPAIDQVKVCAQRSLLAGAVVGAVTTISGVIAGPAGLAAGGIISSTIVAVLNNGKFSSAPKVLLYETTQEEKEKLGKLIREFLHEHHIKSMYEFMKHPELEVIFVKLIINFLSSEMGRSVI